VRSCRACRPPGSPASRRRSLLTVIDGHRLLHQERRAEDEGAIVVVEVGGRRYGLGVGQVVDFLEVPDRAIAGRADLPGVDPRLVRAVGLLDDQPFVVLDMDALFEPIVGG